MIAAPRELWPALSVRSALTKSLRIFTIVSIATMIACAAHAEDDQADDKMDDFLRCVSVWIKRISPQQRIDACTAAIRAEKRSSEDLTLLYVLRGNSYFETKNYTRSLNDLSRAISLNSKSPTARMVRASIRVTTGNLRGALADIGTAIRFAPRKPDYYGDAAMSELFEIRCDVHRRLKKYDRAILDCDTAIKHNSKSPPIFPTRAQIWSTRARIWEDVSDYQRAHLDYTRAIGLGSKSEETHARRGYVNFYRANFEAAVQDFQSALELTPEGRYRAYDTLLLYLARTRTGDASSRTELQTNASKLNSDKWPYPVVDLYLGKTAPEATFAAAGTRDDRCEATFYVAQWHLIRGAKAEAAAHFRTAAKTCPKNFVESKSAVAELKRLGP